MNLLGSRTGVSSVLSPSSDNNTSNQILRKGKWTAEEEGYANYIISCFNEGFLPIVPGTTLRSYLSEKLNCDPMRITKKYAGAACIGKQVFQPCDDSVENKEIINKKLEKLKSLEKIFKDRLKLKGHTISNNSAILDNSLGIGSSSKSNSGGRKLSIEGGRVPKRTSSLPDLSSLRGSSRSFSSSKLSDLVDLNTYHSKYDTFGSSHLIEGTKGDTSTTTRYTLGHRSRSVASIDFYAIDNVAAGDLLLQFASKLSEGDPLPLPLSKKPKVDSGRSAAIAAAAAAIMAGTMKIDDDIEIKKEHDDSSNSNSSNSSNGNSSSNSSSSSSSSSSMDVQGQEGDEFLYGGLSMDNTDGLALHQKPKQNQNQKMDTSGNSSDGSGSSGRRIRLGSGGYAPSGRAPTPSTWAKVVGGTDDIEMNVCLDDEPTTDSDATIATATATATAIGTAVNDKDDAVDEVKTQSQKRAHEIAVSNSHVGQTDTITPEFTSTRAGVVEQGGANITSDEETMSKVAVNDRNDSSNDHADMENDACDNKVSSSKKVRQDIAEEAGSRGELELGLNTTSSTTIINTTNTTNTTRPSKSRRKSAIP